MNDTRAPARHVRAALALCLLAVLPSGALAEDGPAIWEVRGMSGTVRILGSVHFLRDSDYPLPVVVDRVLEQADTVLFELDIDELDPMVGQLLIMRLGVLDDGRRLSDVMGASDYRKAERLAGEIDVDLQMLAAVKPWYAALNVMTLTMVKLGYDPQLGLDQHLAARASEAGKEIVGLETMEFQLRLFDDLPERLQSDLLLQTLEEAAGIEDQMDRMVSAWREGRSDELSGQLSESFREYPSVYRSLVIDRNRDWVGKILEHADRGGNTLVVVGALHLVGEDSVIDLLRSRGVEVVRLEERGS
jgi:uncharacterized protein YbaP (TraB family)